MDRRLRIKKNIKIKLRNLFILLIFFIYPSLTADKLKWKDGTTSIGKAINVTGTHVEWQERGRVKKISLSEIDGIEVGYDGVSVCAEFLPNSQINCDLILHKLTKTSASFTTKDSPLKLDVVKLAKINKLEINFTEKEDYSLFIDSGISGFFETTSFKGNGYLVSNQNKIWEIRPDDKKLPIQKINDGELLRFELVKKAAISEFITTNTPKIIPGFAPAKEKKYWKSAFLFGGSLLSGLGMVYEYNAAVNAINDDIEYIPAPDGRIYIVSNVLSNDRYEFHNQRFQIYAAVFTGFIAYSLLDAFYLGQVESNKGNSNSVWLKPSIIPTVFAKDRMYPLLGNMNTLNYQLEIETRF